MNQNAVNQFLKGTDIYIEGETVFSVAMIVKGRVLMHNSGVKVIMNSGSFLGVQDLYKGKYQSTYTALDELMIYVFPVNRIDELETILSFNKDYHGFMVASFYKMIYELDQNYQGVIKLGTEIYNFITDMYQNYIACAQQNGYKWEQSERIEALSLDENILETLNDRINYYSECRNLPMDAVKSFYSYGNAVTTYQVEDQVDVVNQQIEALKQMSEYFIGLANCLANDSGDSLFHLITMFSAETDNISGTDLLDIMDNIVDKVNKAELLTEKIFDKRYLVNRSRMEEGYHALLSGDIAKEGKEAHSKYTTDEKKKALLELKDAFDKILEYAEIESSQVLEMKEAMSDFEQLRDKHSADDFARKLRRRIAEYYYTIYQKIFVRAYKEKNSSRLIDLFLRYGFTDDKLLTDEQMLSLYFMKADEPKQGECKVYDIKEWLTLIYEGKKDPSKNEFDLEYNEMVVTSKKQGKLTEQEAKIWLTNPEKRLDYEIQNMFRYNNRTTSGQITSFVPVLYSDQCSGNIERLLLTQTKINEAIKKIMKVDYSVFDREMIYSNPEKNIVKEYIIKRVYPDIILMPNVGSNGIMWQEITGKRRDSAGRFILPIFTDADICVLLTRIFGRFRWELCRTIEGASWNDIKAKSLTSEYSDYLQFYRKNKDLSEEKKVKVKQQIQKGRNNSREIFVIDYEQWVTYEASGATKLNKCVREIMATYCPFAKELREKYKQQPLFEEAMARYFRDKQKKIREIEGRYRMLQKDMIELTPELVETLKYYKEQ